MQRFAKRTPFSTSALPPHIVYVEWNGDTKMGYYLDGRGKRISNQGWDWSDLSSFQQWVNNNRSWEAIHYNPAIDPDLVVMDGL